jgi:hypothetical protein
MQTIRSLERTGPDGNLSLRIRLDQPNTDFEVLVVVQAKLPANATPTPTAANPWAGAKAIRDRLEATGRDFADSVPDIREDRDR